MKIRNRWAISFESVRERGGNCNDVTTGALRGQDTGGRIFENQAIPRSRAHSVNRQSIALRVWLAYRNVIRRNEKNGKGETCRQQSARSQLSTCRRNNRPVAVGHPTKEIQGAGDRADIVGIVALTRLQLTCFPVDVDSLRCKQLHDFLSAAPMSYCQYVVRRNSVLQRPIPPCDFYRSSGIDQRAIHVKDHFVIDSSSETMFDIGTFSVIAE